VAVAVAATAVTLIQAARPVKPAAMAASQAAEPAALMEILVHHKVPAAAVAVKVGMAVQAIIAVVILRGHLCM
jgi:hypothetical protein